MSEITTGSTEPTFTATLTGNLLPNATFAVAREVLKAALPTVNERQLESFISGNRVQILKSANKEKAVALAAIFRRAGLEVEIAPVRVPEQLAELLPKAADSPANPVRGAREDRRLERLLDLVREWYRRSRTATKRAPGIGRGQFLLGALVVAAIYVQGNVSIFNYSARGGFGYEFGVINHGADKILFAFKATMLVVWLALCAFRWRNIGLGYRSLSLSVLPFPLLGYFIGVAVGALAPTNYGKHNHWLDLVGTALFYVGLALYSLALFVSYFR